MNNFKSMFFSFFCLIGIFVSCSAHNGFGGNINSDVRIDNFENKLSGWSVFKHPTVDIRYSLDSGKVRDGKMAMKIDYSFHDNKKMFVAFIVKELGRSQDWSKYDSIGLWSYIPEKAIDLRGLSVMVYEEDGSAYIAQNVRNLKGTGWERSFAQFSKFIYSSGGQSKNKESKPNLKQIRKISVGIFQPVAFRDKSYSIYIDDIRLFKEGDGDTDVAPSSEDSRRKTVQVSSTVVDNFDSGLVGWKKNIAPTIKLDYSIDNSVKKHGKKSLKVEYDFKKKKSFWGYINKDLGTTRNWRSYDSINFWSYIPKAAKDLIGLSVMLYEADGSAFIAQHVRGLKSTGWEETTVPFLKFYLAGKWTNDENGKLDLDEIRKVSIGIFQPKDFSESDFIIYLNNIRVVQSQTQTQTQTLKTNALSETSEQVVRTNELGKLEPPDGNVYHGVFAFSAPLEGWGSIKSDWEGQIDVKQISEYEGLCGRPAAIASFFWFLDWEFPTKMCEKINKLGKISHLHVTTGGIRLSHIIDGKVDEKIVKWANEAKNFERPIFFRFLSEMNGNWRNFSEANDPSQTHQMYVKAWQHVVHIFREAGADNIIWIWAPTGIDVGDIHWTDYYPGDDYVDWVGVSVYSFLGDGDPEPQIMGIYNDYAARKPIMIAECGAGDADNNPNRYMPGKKYFDNPEKWIERFFDTLENKAPRVKAFAWFNIDRERVWKIQEASSKIKIFKNRLSNKRYGAKLK